jgi:hypothetical protein
MTLLASRAYYAAWTNRKGAGALRQIMAEASIFDSALTHVEGREQFLAGASANGWPERAVATLLAGAYDGEHGFQIYTATNGGKKVKIAEHLIIRDGHLEFREVVVDGAAFREFMTG